MRPRLRRAGVARGVARQAPFAALIGADAISLNGNALAQLAIPWFVLETTGSAARTGIVAAAGLLPLILANFFGGAVVDRLGHRRASIVADGASAVAVGLIPLLHAEGLLPFPILLLLVFLGALLDAPGRTARAALLPDAARLAGLRLERANALHEIVESGAQLSGPILAGAAIGWIGPDAVLWLDAASFAISAALVAAPAPVGRGATGAGEGRSGDYLAELVAVLRFVRGDGPIRAIFVSAAVLNALISPLFAVILPVYAQAAHGSAASLGLLVAAFGGGSAAGAVVYGAVGHRLPRRGTFVTGVGAIGAAIAALALLPSLPVMAGALALGGLIAGPNGPLVATVLQERTPAALRGRVFGATTAIGFAAAPLGVLLAGALIPAIGVRGVLAGSAVIFLGVVLALARDAGLRELDRLEGTTPGQPT